MLDIEQNRLAVYYAAAQLLEDEGYSAVVRTGYSGRGMEGNTVPAIVTDAPGAMVGWAITAAACLDDFEIPDEFEIPGKDIPKNQDHMGLSLIYY